MKINDLIDHLKMFPPDMEVLIQTTPDDLCQPVTRKAFSMITAKVDDRYGLQPTKLVLTAYHPEES